jgi:CHASE3 domain sensor protein
MIGNWTFGRKLGAGFGFMVVLVVALGAAAVHALRAVVASKDEVITVDAQLLIDAGRFETTIERKSAALRGFLLTRDEHLIDQMREAHSSLETILGRLESRVHTEEGLRLLGDMEATEREHQEAVEGVLALRRTEAPVETIIRAFQDKILPTREKLDTHLRAFVTREETRLLAATQASTDDASSAVILELVLCGAAALFAVLMSLLLTRVLGRQIGTSVGQVQSSSAELQSAAREQATGAMEQAAAMTEVSTTIAELLATSRQIADTVQRVAEVAQETAGGARSGETLVETGRESIAAIRRQVDLIVGNLLELGKKSQQIGAVLEIVSELAEQTNILAINATIEAVGAGESGRRFTVVADEIRKLADRVAGSTKEIRSLIEDVRGAVSTTVMTTETGSKAVEIGARQFSEVASAFKRIAALVVTSMEAAREIELSTRQQATAVEQVQVAISNVTQATQENQASSAQTLQTASQLAGLSRQLQRLVQPEAV